MRSAPVHSLVVVLASVVTMLSSAPSAAAIAEVPVAFPVLSSVSIDKPAVVADGHDVQSVTLAIAAPYPHVIDQVFLAITDQPTGSLAHPQSLFRWTRTNGFRSAGGGTNGWILTNLLSENAAAPDQGSYATDTVNGTTVTFRWTTNPVYGSVPANHLRIHFASSTTQFQWGWRRGERTFAVDANGYRPPELVEFSSEKSVVYADGSDVQSMRVTLATDSPERLGHVALGINIPGTTFTHPGGLFRWSPVVGFSSVGGSYSGEYFVDLLRAPAGDPGPRSEVLWDPAARTLTLVFRWTVRPHYGLEFDNVPSVSFSEVGTGFQQRWVTSHTLERFTVFPATSSARE